MAKTEEIVEIMLSIPQRIISYNSNPEGQYLYFEQRKQIAESIYKWYNKEKETVKKILNEIADWTIDSKGNTIKDCKCYKRLCEKYDLYKKYEIEMVR